MKKIGIDFDNTIACYTNVFFQAALEKKLIPETLGRTKNSVRDYLRNNKKEKEWTELQGYIYGARMDLAQPFAGVLHFLHHCHERKIVPIIISHKTKYPYLGPQYDLHAAAKQWLAQQKFPLLATFFEVTLEEKLQRIKACQCDYFIDDLPELFTEPQFPRNTTKILFSPDISSPCPKDCLPFSSWHEICTFFKVTHE